jgi:ketosteroid isomerase-like protein
MADVTSEVTARQEIAEVLFRYGYALDERDWDRLERCFTPDAAFHHSGGSVFGAEEIRAGLRTALGSLSVSQHLIGSVSVVVAADGQTATSTCYVQAQHVRAGAEGGKHLLLGGRYADRLVHTEDGWRIADRALRVMWSAGNEAVLANSP